MSIQAIVRRQLKLFTKGGELVTTNTIIGKKTVATITTAGAGTYTAAQLLGGLILRDPAGADRTDTTSTAALLIAAVAEARDDSSFELIVRNTADGDEIITVAGGTGVTMSGKVTINRGESRRFLVVITDVSASTVTLYDIGLVTNTYLLQAEITDISTASGLGYVLAPFAGELIRVYAVLHGAIITANAVITIASSVGNVVETITVTQSGSAAGDIDVINPASHANTVIAAGTTLKATTDGASGNVVRLTVVFEIERT